MATLSSRPELSTAPTQQDVMDAVTPTVNILTWLSTLIQFPDDHPSTIMEAGMFIESALENMMLYDFAVAPIPGPMSHLHYDVAAKPFPDVPFVIFQVRFVIR